jgi:hypothetical protein
MLIPCDAAVQDPVSGKWVLTNPWAVAVLPPGMAFPFDHEQLWLYAQLTDGVGEVQVVTELCRVLPDDTRRVVKRWKHKEPIDFPGGQQLRVFDLALDLRVAPFDEPGVYEFGLLANYAPLQGQVAEFRVLDARDHL